MAVRKGLGKGLDSLILSRNEGDFEKEKKKDAPENVSHETLVKITKIEPNRAQPRRHFNEDLLQELADSIKQHGVIEPLIVQKRGGGSHSRDRCGYLREDEFADRAYE